MLSFRRGKTKQSTENTQGCETKLYTIMVNTCRYNFIHNHGINDPTQTLNYKIWGVICQCSFIYVRNVPLWWGVRRKGRLYMWGQKAYGNSLTSTQFSSEPQTALKDKVILRLLLLLHICSQVHVSFQWFMLMQNMFVSAS